MRACWLNYLFVLIFLTHSVSTSRTCSEQILVSYFSPIAVYNPEDIFNLAALQPATHMCRKVAVTLISLEEYLSSCNLTTLLEVYAKLASGIKTMFNYVCMDLAFQNRFSKFRQCARRLRHELSECAAGGDWVELQPHEKGCPVMNETINCVYIKLGLSCGKKAADVSAELLEAIFTAVLDIKCDVSLPFGLDFAPDSAASRKSFSQNLLLFMMLIVIIF